MTRYNNNPHALFTLKVAQWLKRRLPEDDIVTYLKKPIPLIKYEGGKNFEPDIMNLTKRIVYEVHYKGNRKGIEFSKLPEGWKGVNVFYDEESNDETIIIKERSFRIRNIEWEENLLKKIPYSNQNDENKLLFSAWWTKDKLHIKEPKERQENINSLLRLAVDNINKETVSGTFLIKCNSVSKAKDDPLELLKPTQSIDFTINNKILNINSGTTNVPRTIGCIKLSSKEGFTVDIKENNTIFKICDDLNDLNYYKALIIVVNNYFNIVIGDLSNRYRDFYLLDDNFKEQSGSLIVRNVKKLRIETEIGYLFPYIERISENISRYREFHQGYREFLLFIKDFI